MKNELLIGISILVIIIAGMGLSVSRNTSNITSSDEGIPDSSPHEFSNIAGRLSHNVIFNAPVQKEKDRVLVYKTLPPIVNQEITMNYAKKFNVTGELRGVTTVQSKDLTYFVTVTAISGAIRYANQDRPNKVMDAPEKLPTDDEAIKIATKFLKGYNLYPEGAGEPKAIRENTYASKRVVTYGEIGVWYPRELNGMKVIGTQLVVDIGGNGDVIGYFANWRNYEPIKEYPIKTPDDAFNQLKVKGVVVGENPADTTVTFNDVYLAYNTEPAAFKEVYLQPVWVFKGNAVVDGKPVLAITEYIPALTVVPPEFGGPKPVTSAPTTSVVINLTTTQTITEIVSVNETATPSISTSPTVNTTTIATEEINQTATITLPTTTIVTNTTTGFNATNGS